MAKAKNPTKPVRLSAHATLCILTGAESLAFGPATDRIVRHLKRLKVEVPKLGPAPSGESILSELKNRRDWMRARKAKRKHSDPDQFVLYAWSRCRPETRAQLIRDGDDGALAGDTASREFARTVRGMFDSAYDFESFLDELLRGV